MSVRERLPDEGYDKGEGQLIFECCSGFVIAEYGGWLPGIYLTFEAAEMAFLLTYATLRILAEQRRPITLSEVEQMLELEGR